MFERGTRPPLRLVALAALSALLALWLTCAVARAATIETFQVPTANAGLNTMVEGPDGNLYFTEDNDVVVNGQETFHVGELTTGGQVSELPVPFGDSDSSGTGMGPTSITTSGGKLWFVSDVGSSLYTMGPGMTGLTKIASPTGTTGFDSADQIAPAPGGGVWATTIDGSAAELFDASGNETDFSVNYTDPGTLAENPSGGMDYGNGSSSINTIDASGNQASYPLPNLGAASEVYSMAFDRAGNLWYGTFSGGGALETGPYYGAIGVLRPGAASGQTVVNFTPASGIGPYPRFMILGPDGAIWFSWSTSPNGEQTKMPSGIGRLDPSTGQYQLFDTVKSNNLVPGAIAFGGDGALYFLDATDNLLGRITDPSSLFASSPGPTPKPKPTKRPLAPRPKLSIPHTTLRAIGRHDRMRVTCRLRSAGRCTVRAQVRAKVARGLGVKVRKHANTATLARASRKLRKKGAAHLTLRFSARTSRHMARRHKLTLTLVVTATAPRHRARTVTRHLTLHHG